MAEIKNKKTKGGSVSLKGSEGVAVRLERVTKSFRGGRDIILKDVSIEFPAGKLTYILGPSGVGKSVLLKHVLGLMSPDRGSVWAGDREITRLKKHELSKYRLTLGMLFQNAALFDDFSVFENVAFPLREHTHLSDEAISEKVTSVLTLLGMPEGYDKFPSELSGGMKKRVALARAIIREPSILLYDEPTTGLDPVTRITVDDLIAQLKKELSVTSIVISHDIPSALWLADKIAFLHDGRFVFEGTPDEFRKTKNPSILEFLAAEERTVNALTGKHVF